MTKVLETSKMLPFDPTTPIFPIGIIAEETNLHPRTLRMYDEEGFVSPTRTETNRRKYSVNDLRAIEAIQYGLKELGLNKNALRIIKAIYDMDSVCEGSLCASIPMEELLKRAALKAGITEDIQKENRIRYSGRGRKKN